MATGIRDDGVSIPCTGVSRDGRWLDFDFALVDHPVRHADPRGRDPGTLHAFNLVKYDLRALPEPSGTVIFTSEITTTDNGWRAHADTVSISVQLAFDDGNTHTLRYARGRNPDRGSGPTTHEYLAPVDDPDLAERLARTADSSPLTSVRVRFHGEIESD